MSSYRNRREAGRLLARALTHHGDRNDVVVLGLPPGGIPLAFEIAAALRAPLDVLVVRLLGVPNQDTVAMGAVATGGVRVIEADVVTRAGVTKTSIESVIAREWHELVRQEHDYRAGLDPLDVKDRVAILVDDGTTSIASLRAAVMALKRQAPSRIVVAIPALTSPACDALSKLVDEIVCSEKPEPFIHVGSRYADFSPVLDGEVRSLLAEAVRESAA